MDAVSAKTALPGSAAESLNSPPELTTLAQLVSLTTWGSAFLHRGADASALNRDQSTLRNCNKVAFAEIRGLLRSREVPIAADPLTWLKLLREQGYRFVRMHFQPPVSLSPADDSGWILETHADETVDRWGARWSLTNRYAAQNRCWSVVYRRLARKSELPKVQSIALDPLRERLGTVLMEFQEFATRQNQTQWSQCLAQARSLLDAEKPFEGHAHSDLLPRTGGTPAARQLLASCCQALVCEVDKTVPPTGDDPELNAADYNRLMSNLRAAVYECVEPAANLWAEGPA